MFDLLKNAAATGAGVQVPRGEYAFAVYGTFGGATASLERLLPDGTWLAAGPDATMIARGQCIADLPGGVYRASLTGGTPTGMNAYLSAAE